MFFSKISTEITQVYHIQVQITSSTELQQFTVSVCLPGVEDFLKGAFRDFTLMNE